MSVGPKIAAAAKTLEIGAGDGSAAAPGTPNGSAEADPFGQIMADLGRSPEVAERDAPEAEPADVAALLATVTADSEKPLTVRIGEDATVPAPTPEEAPENLTIKTFQQPLGVKPGEARPKKAAGEDELNPNETEAVLTKVDAAVVPPLPGAVPLPLASPAVAAAKPSDAPEVLAAASIFLSAPVAVPISSDARPKAAMTQGAAMPIPVPAPASVPAPATPAALATFAQPVTPKAGESTPAEPDFVVKAFVAASVVPAAREQAKPSPVATPLSDIRAVSPSSIAVTADSLPSDEPASAPAPNPAPPTTLFFAPVQPFMQAVAAPVDAAPAAAPTPAGEIFDATIEQQLDLAHEGEWLDRLARDIARTAGAEGGLRFRLNPEHLGSLHVELNHGHGGASLRLTADTEAARAIIADAQPRLVAEARAQGVRIAESHVGLGANGHPAGGDQRRHEPPQSFVRTIGSGGARETEAAAPTTGASERYA